MPSGKTVAFVGNSDLCWLSGCIRVDHPRALIGHGLQCKFTLPSWYSVIAHPLGRFCPGIGACRKERMAGGGLFCYDVIWHLGAVAINVPFSVRHCYPPDWLNSEDGRLFLGAASEIRSDYLIDGINRQSGSPMTGCPPCSLHSSGAQGAERLIHISTSPSQVRVRAPCSNQRGGSLVPAMRIRLRWM